MPCNSIQINEVQWQKVSKEWLEKAIAELGWTMQTYGTRVVVYGPQGRMDIELSTGEVRGSISEQLMNQQLNKLKQGYSNHLVKAQAQKHGWAIKQTAPNKYQVMKR